MADEKRLYVFYGRILPERAHVYFNLKQKKAEIAGVNVEFDVFCFGSQFNGTAKFDKDVTQLEVQTIVQALMRSFLDRLCFENICAYDFDLTGAVSVASGDKWIYGVKATCPNWTSHWCNQRGHFSTVTIRYAFN